MGLQLYIADFHRIFMREVSLIQKEAYRGFPAPVITSACCAVLECNGDQRKAEGVLFHSFSKNQHSTGLFSC